MNGELETFEQMFFSIFDPKKEEKILLVYDKPHNNIKDTIKWKERRTLVKRWYEFLQMLSKKHNFFVTIESFDATGINNKLLDNLIRNRFKKYNIFIAMTEFSITTTCVKLAKEHPESIRCASMPMVEKRMEETVLNMDYSQVKKYAQNLKLFLHNSLGATIHFSTDDSLYIDLRNRSSGADDGDCTKPGNTINLPSGEGFSAPYEGTIDERGEFNESKTKGVLPIFYKDAIMKAIVDENTIASFTGKERYVQELELFFNAHPFRRNIAELGIGCNPKAKVTGNLIEDEKVGLHIAYGTSSHIGGKITSDVHKDIVYAKHCPIEAETVILHTKKENIEIISNAQLDYRKIDH